MTTGISVATDLAHRASPRWRRVERLLLRAAAVTAILHVLDDRVLTPSAGADRAADVLATVALIGLTGVCALSARVHRPAAVAVVLATLGAVYAGDGGTHVARLASGDGVGADVRGAPAALAGLVLLLLALVGAFRRTRPARRGTWRWLDRTVTLAVVLAVTICLVAPVVIGTVQVHLPRRPVGPPPSSQFRPVTLLAADGPALQAWYWPSRNGAAVMVLNSARGDHVGSNEHALLLARRGYGVLVYDARGTGGSEGTPNGWGWTWLPDVEAGVDFLEEQEDVVDDGIGLLGLSTGADVAIEAAAQDERIRVVVADGATAQGFADRPGGWQDALSLWPMYATAQMLTGHGPAPALVEAMASLAPRRTLLVAAGSIPQEIPLNRRYQAAGGKSVELWELANVHHTGGLAARPEEYAARVLGLLDQELLEVPALETSGMREDSAR